ncbi:MAG: hypothetical protein JWO99_51 [Candidatus Saccharibacteria bacterium]|nr:hypothetical protein [Candidatus Saccharibacteria bacterium]
MLKNRYSSMGKSDKKLKSKKSRRILLIAVILVVVGASAGVYFGYVLPHAKKTDTSAGSTDKVTTAYQEKLKQNQDKVTKLVNAGDAQSIDQATQLVNTNVTTAQATGDDRQIVDAQLAKASFMMDIGQAQQSLDTVLLPLNDKYGNNNTYKYDIYGALSRAYREIGDTTKADSYFSQIPSEGWN